MRNLIGCLSAMMMLLAVVSCVNSKHAKNYNDMVDGNTSSFIKQGLENSETGIKASKLAQTASKNTRVINFAQMVVTDNDGISDDLQKFAIADKITGGDSVSATHLATITDLNNYSGVKFDKAYLTTMITGHQDAIKLFTAAKADNNEDIKKFANKTLPILQAHLDSATAIAASLK
ncbi:DUF4142 domain-containing protein [Mucilaginibacter sp. dw_454]|uniref:DUF4142 domain-containing protein n=1 Tax=Mucilaginibacter sp. dw_454 TaxID=2720079 RepID=UPI001BD5B60E|nr:DUF4142 domain-containing protein [Mucilaginibacter sp. dw_454]